jgi:hypothetical protein
VLISTIEEAVGAQPWRKKKLHELKCDLPGCQTLWLVPYRGNRPEDKLDFCCVEHKYDARRRGEIFDTKLKELSLKKWGVPSASCLEENQKKRAQTKEERWGDRNYNNRQKAEQTCQERMGCKNPSQSDNVKEKIRRSMVDRWGVESPIQHNQIRDKIKKTMLDRWGAPHAWCTPENRERNKSKEIRNKIHRTMKARGRYGKSKVEDQLYYDLCELYSPANVERQASLNGWSIDFKVNDVYVQLDGVYWHGLDRSLEELRASQNARDKVILGTRSRDSEQNEWCQKMGIRLVRVTDAEYSARGVASIVDKIER